jgi:hypothetical protein
LKSDESLACFFVFDCSLVFSHYQPEGKSVIEFNAGFNTKNGYKDLAARLQNAKLYRVDIEAKPHLKTSIKIKSVPTLILFRDGEEMWRWEAGIDMKLHTHHLDIQEVNKKASFLMDGQNQEYAQALWTFWRKQSQEDSIAPYQVTYGTR